MKPQFDQMTLEQRLAFGGDRPCGARMKILGIRTEELLFQFGFHWACRKHDFAYLRGKTLMEKIEADFEFLDTLIECLNKTGQAWQLPFAILYFNAVLFFGWGFHFAKEYRTLEEIIELDKKTRYMRGQSNTTTPGVS